MIILEDDVSDYEELTLTVTRYNTITVIESVQTGEACVGYIYGDTNGDSVVNIIDVVTLVNFVLGSDTPDNCQLEYSDLNADGILNIMDIILAVNIILGNI